MNNKLKSINKLIVVAIIFVITGCDKFDTSMTSDPADKKNIINPDKISWQQEIQQRFDILYQMADGVECLALHRIDNFPYRRDSNYLSQNTSLVLKKLSNIGLVAESIFEEKDSYYKDRTNIIYQYDLTDLGKQYFKKWTNIGYSGFCFGKIVVTDITTVKPIDQEYQVSYSYTISQAPDNIKNLIDDLSLSYYTWFIDFKHKTKTVEFRVDDAGRLYSRSGNALIVHHVDP